MNTHLFVSRGLCARGVSFDVKIWITRATIGNNERQPIENKHVPYWRNRKVKESTAVTAAAAAAALVSIATATTGDSSKDLFAIETTVAKLHPSPLPFWFPPSWSSIIFSLPVSAHRQGTSAIRNMYQTLQLLWTLILPIPYGWMLNYFMEIADRSRKNWLTVWRKWTAARNAHHQTLHIVEASF